MVNRHPHPLQPDVSSYSCGSIAFTSSVISDPTLNASCSTGIYRPPCQQLIIPPLAPHLSSIPLHPPKAFDCIAIGSHPGWLSLKNVSDTWTHRPRSTPSRHPAPVTSKPPNQCIEAPGRCRPRRERALAGRFVKPKQGTCTLLGQEIVISQS